MSSVNEETKQELSAGDPEGGNVTHDTSPVFGTGTLPDVEQEIYDEREKAREEQAKTVAEGEDEVAKRRQAENEEREKKRLAEQEAETASTPSTKTASKSSSSSTSSSS